MSRALLLLLLLPAAACASAQAKQPPIDHPSLEVPPPPPRMIEPVPSTEPPEIQPVPELPSAPATPPRPRPRPDTKPPDAKPDAKPETPTETPATPPATASPVPPLRTPGAAEGAEAARQVRDAMDRTLKLLESVDYGKLSNERKANYEAAKRFITQAEDAVKANNYVFAKSLADRAEMLAKELAGR